MASWKVLRRNEPSHSAKTVLVSVLTTTRPSLRASKSEALQSKPVALGERKWHTRRYTMPVKPFRWSPDKNRELLAERGVSFEQAVVAIQAGGLLDVLTHPNPKKHPSQRVLVVTWDGYAYLVPCVEEPEYYFLKTVIPSRKATRDYLHTGDPDDAA